MARCSLHARTFSRRSGVRHGPTVNISSPDLSPRPGCRNVAAMHYKLPLLAVLTASLLAACGGGNDNSSNGSSSSGSGSSSSQARGTLLNAPVLLSTTSVVDMLTQLTTDASSQTFGTQVPAQVQALAGAPLRERLSPDFDEAACEREPAR